MESVKEILESMGLGQFADEFKGQGYDDTKIIEMLSLEEAEELCTDVGMKKGHTKTFLKGYKEKFSSVTAAERLALRQYMLVCARFMIVVEFMKTFALLNSRWQTEIFKVSDSSELKEPDIIKMFKSFDTDLDGKICMEEFREAAVKLGFYPTGDELKLLVKVTVC